ncbi:hypothetical protein D6D01_02760 [Aureobasidium pullulans]|uniref:RanBD1 domain-containing protein n=1 Tax=Aureobasidium pullulans TaxID=5580 RepID=A0A4S9LRS6_AURPU|nr:hypothetical protein D6D01_02760 [Aureobasidium pullulans]
MSTPPKDVHTSDTEGGERPLRERLRNASIKSAKQPTDTLATTEPEPEKARAKLQRKRSHEDVESVEDEPAPKSRQARKSKRSRENSPEEKVAEQSGKRKSSELERDDEPVAVEISQPSVPSTSTVTTIETDGLTKSDESPKSKRSRVDDKATADTASSATSDAKATIEPEGKTGQEQTKPAIKLPAGSGFANTSAASPFASLATSKSPSEQPQPTTSAFASSVFGALAGSSTSAFGALGQSKTLSSFASPGTTPAPGEDATKPVPKPSAFGGLASGASPFATAGSSGFGSGASGFGKLGNGFGGGFGGLGGSKLTNFASSGTPGVIGSSTKTGITAFGAPAEDGEEQSGDEEDNEAGVKSPKLIVDEDKKDERFFEQEIETGEEGETTEYTCRAKLYNFVDKKEWKERGLGVLRLNVTEPQADDEDSTLKARLVMRADGSHRVILNTPIQKGLKFGDVHGARPTGGYMSFMGSLDGKPTLEFLQLKLRQQFAMELWDHIAELQKQM